MASIVLSFYNLSKCNLPFFFFKNTYRYFITQSRLYQAIIHSMLLLQQAINQSIFFVPFNSLVSLGNACALLFPSLFTCTKLYLFRFLTLFTSKIIYIYISCKNKYKWFQITRMEIFIHSYNYSYSHGFEKNLLK